MVDEPQKEQQIIMLRGVLAGAGVDPEVVTHMMDTLQIASVTDFVCYVKRCDYYEDLGTRILDTLPRSDEGQPHVLCDNKLELTRLQAAWESSFVAYSLMRKEKEKIKKRKREQVLTCLQTSGGQLICKSYNDARICTQSESACPVGGCHVCDVRKPDGTACGSKSHTRLSGSCPYRTQQIYVEQK